MQNEATLKKHVTKLRVVMHDLVDDILGSDPGSLSLQDSVGDLQHPPLGNPHHRVGHKPQNSIILEGSKGTALGPGILKKLAPQKCKSQGPVVAREHLTAQLHCGSHADTVCSWVHMSVYT